MTKVSGRRHRNAVDHWQVLAGAAALVMIPLTVIGILVGGDAGPSDADVDGNGNSLRHVEGDHGDLNYTENGDVNIGGSEVQGQSEVIAARCGDEAPVDHVLDDAPYPYYVCGTGDLGLLVRSCAEATCPCVGTDCELLGLAINEAPVYADCHVNSWDAGEGTDVWLQIRWSNTVAGTRARGASSPQSEGTGFVYAGWVEPSGHSGELPRCS